MELDQFRDVDLVIDRANDSFVQKQFVSQGDYKGRSLTVQVTDNGSVGEVPGLTLNLRWHNEASGLTDLSAFSVIDKSNSIFRIEYPQNMMTPGKVFASVQILQNGKITQLKEFQLTVQQLAGEAVGIAQKAEFSALVAVLADANKFRTDIGNLDKKKADISWTQATFATSQTQFTSTYFTLAALKSAFPSGATGTYLVLEDNNLYAYESGNWVSKGLYEASVDVKKGSVTPEKLKAEFEDYSLVHNRNLFKNSTFDGTTNWASPDSTLSASGGQLTVTSKGTSVESRVTQNIDIYADTHKYLLMAQVSVNNSECTKIQAVFYNSSNIIKEINNPVKDHIYTVIALVDGMTIEKNSIWFKQIYAANATTDSTLTITKPVLINLSETYTNNIPPIDDLKAMYSNYTDYFFGDYFYYSTNKEQHKKIERLRNIVDDTTYDLKNKLKNPEFDTILNWGSANTSDGLMTVGNRRLSIVGYGNSNTLRLRQAVDFDATHKYYISTQIKMLSSNTLKISLRVESTEIASMNNPQRAVENTLTGITSGQSGSTYYIRADFSSNENQKDQEMIIGKPIIIDLTEIFGFGNEPDLETFNYVINQFVGGYIDNTYRFSNLKLTQAIVATNRSKSLDTFNSNYYTPTIRIPSYSGNETFNAENMRVSDLYGLYDKLILDYPNYLQKDLIGKDQSGTYDIFKITTNKSIQGARIKVLLSANLHGPGSGGDPRDVAIVLYHFMEDMLKNYKSNEHLQWLYYNVQFVFIPLANPWGWDNGTRENSRGIDLNRNFDYNHTPSSMWGATPFSEVETQYIKTLVEDNEDAEIYIDMHCYADNPIDLRWAGYSGDRLSVGYKTMREVGLYMTEQFGGTRQIGISTNMATSVKWAERVKCLDVATIEASIYHENETPHNQIAMNRLLNWYGNCIYRFCKEYPFKNYILAADGNKYKQRIGINGTPEFEKLTDF
ncbi:M14 family zinc carboxypeptidase [Enterococcus casseliflavus]|uniref:M14 family zinc carboxypeptidase n=1 Tax=Enterococcus casseliflavus TaxID=37734 RepID=UPI003D0EBE54